MKDVLLTIGIPVYNGEKFIKQTLDSIIVALKNEIIGEIEILISDNCSIDKTEEIINTYINIGKLKLKYYKNDKNYQYDGNIDLIAKRAKGKYIWFLGCGEIVKSNSLSIITEKISKDTYDTVLLNFDIYSEEIDKIDGTSAYPIKKDIIINSKEEMFQKYNGAAMAISANIVLKSGWSQNQLLEIGWCHIERINNIIVSGEYKKSLIIYNKCFTLYREQGAWWTTDLVYKNYIIYCKLMYSLRNNLTK